MENFEKLGAFYLGKRVAKVAQEIEILTDDFDDEVEAMDDAFDAQAEELKEILVRARSGNIQIKFFGLGWRPEVDLKS